MAWLLRRLRGGAPPAPGPTGWPVVGNALQIEKDKFHVILNQWAQEYGDVFQFSLFGNAILVLNSQELFESVSEKMPHRPFNISSTLIYNDSGVFFGNKRIVYEETGRVFHKIVADKAVHELSGEMIAKHVDDLRKSADSGVEMIKTMRRVTAEHMLVTILGHIPEEKDAEAFERFIQKYKDLFGGSAGVVLTAMPWLRFVPGPMKRKFDDSKTEMEKMVEGYMEAIRNGEGSARGAVDILMARKAELDNDENQEEKLTDDNIKAIVVDALVGSVVPMAYTVIGIMACMMKHPAVQDKIHAELDRVCPNKPPLNDDNHKLHYLNATLLECRRYLCIVPATVPHTTIEDTEINGYFVEKGTQLLGNIFHIHHDEAKWEDGWEFRPERFLDSTGHILPTDHHLRKSVHPFGTGPRMCKGYNIAEQFLFAYFSSVLYHFEILPEAGGEPPDCDPRTFIFSTALTPPDVHCRFEPRAKKK